MFLCLPSLLAHQFHPAVPLCHHLWRSGPASWAAQSHYPAKPASGQVWGFFLVYACVCSELAVYYLWQYNIHSWMPEQWVTISDCTNTQQQTGPSGCLGLCFLKPCNSSDLVYSSWLHVTAVWSPLKGKRDESRDKSLKQLSTRIWQVELKL